MRLIVRRGSSIVGHIVNLDKNQKYLLGGSDGTIAMKESGKSSRWVDKFFIPDGETRTISAIRDENYEESNKYWGDAKQQLVNYLLNKEK